MASSGKKVLIIRLDDIGDYLLFRNHFAVYKNSPRWAGHEVVLLGNGAWADLFAALDRDKADRVIWVDKGKYLQEAEYRMELWTRLRQEGFETVICPSRTRPLLLDDLCVLATGAGHRLASVNTFPDAAWNRVSDSLYTELFRGGDPLGHEFYFNGVFAQWCCGAHFEGRRPEIRHPFSRKIPGALYPLLYRFQHDQQTMASETLDRVDPIAWSKGLAGRQGPIWRKGPI